MLERRLERAFEEGELLASTNCVTLPIMSPVQHGMPIRTRDGASWETLLTIADCAMESWMP